MKLYTELPAYKIVGCLAAIFAIFIIGRSTSIYGQEVGTTIIDETFASSASNFTEVRGGTWSVTSEQYRLTSASTSCNGPLCNISVHNTEVTTDFTLTVKGSAVSSTSSWDDFAVIFSYKDVNNYSYASFNESNDAATNGIFKVVNGTSSQLVDFSGTTAPSSTLYTIEISRAGNQISVKKNGVSIGSATDTSFGEGKVGVGAFNNSASFDDLKVIASKGTPPQSPTPSPSPTSRPVNVSAAFIGQSILHKPGTAGTHIDGKNLFYYFLEWGKGSNADTTQAHYTISGAGLFNHMNNDRTNSLINRGLDYFVMCEGPKYLWERSDTERNARTLGDKARKAGSIPVIYIAYSHKPSSCSRPYCTAQGMMDGYMRVAKNLNMAFIPVAYATGEAVKAFGEGGVYTDDVHINSATQFLNGCVTWATLTQTPADQINYFGNLDGISSSRRDTLIRICKDTIRKYPPNSSLLKRN
jgi:hypothetical protein